MAQTKIRDMEQIQKLVGNISEENLKYVDCYVADEVGVFIPSVGYCEYAITPEHTHPAYSFVLFFNEAQQIVPPKIKVEPNHYFATAMGPLVSHTEEMGDRFTRYIAVFISKRMFEEVYKDYLPTMPVNYTWDQFLVPHEIMFDLKRFMSEYESSSMGSVHVLSALSITITHQIIRSLLNIQQKIDVITDKFEIEKTIEYMYQHYGEKLTIGTLAQNVNMSESHYTRTFKKEIGEPPMDFLIKVRINKAKKLLRSGTMNMTEIASCCGFSNASHFSSTFAKHTGLAPTAYQRSF